MAPSRPFWKGYLKLSLVSCPIAMFPASSSSERVSFRQINKSHGTDHAHVAVGESHGFT